MCFLFVTTQKIAQLPLEFFADLWTTEGLELVAWMRAERSSSCVLLPEIACFKLVRRVCHCRDYCTRIALFCRQNGSRSVC